MKDIRIPIIAEISWLTDNFNLDSDVQATPKEQVQTLLDLITLYERFDSFVTEQETNLRYKKESKE